MNEVFDRLLAGSRGKPMKRDRHPGAGLLGLRIVEKITQIVRSYPVAYIAKKRRLLGEDPAPHLVARHMAADAIQLSQEHLAFGQPPCGEAGAGQQMRSLLPA